MALGISGEHVGAWDQPGLKCFRRKEANSGKEESIHSVVHSRVRDKVKPMSSSAWVSPAACENAKFWGLD